MNGQVRPVTVAGNGLTAMSMALSLAKGQASRTVALISNGTDKGLESRSGSRGGERIIALAASSVSLLGSLGIHFGEAEATSIQQILVSDKGHLGATRLLAEECQVPALGLVVRESLLKEKLRTELLRYANLVQVQGEIQQLAPEQDQIDLLLSDQSALSTKLLVLADGSDSPLAELVGCSSRRKDYRQTALTAEVITSLPHRNRAFERFTRWGPMALLPLEEPNRWNLIWALPNQQGADFAQDVSILLENAQREFGYRAGRLEKVEKVTSWPLALVRRRPVAQSRTLLAGNAANTLHPVAGQGFNLALRDVSALTQLICEQGGSALSGGDPGSPALFEAYSRQREKDHQTMVRFTDTLPGLFRSRFPPLVVSRNLGMMLLDTLPGVKSLFARRAMGWRDEGPQKF